MKQITDKEFELISEFVRKNYGINLGKTKKPLVYSRLNKHLKDLGIYNFTEYYKYLTADLTGQAKKDFIDRISTNHTYFMREKTHFDYLEKDIFPYLENKHKNTKDIRIWCAGCSSGEESYVLQILLKEYFSNRGFDTKLLATDISTKALTKAYKGIYQKKNLEALPNYWVKRYFEKYDENNLIASKKLKDEIIYRRFNLMEKVFPFKKNIQVIFCRNVMIYFDSEIRDQLVRKFYEHTEEGGYLFIGHSESLSHSDTKYEYVAPSIYRKNSK